MFRNTIVVAYLLIVGSYLNAQIRLEIKSLPSYHTSSSNVYIAGSFNGWNPHDEIYKFNKDANGNYFIEMALNYGSYEYKITRGGWDKVECQSSGTDIANRKLKVAGDTTIEINIEGWKDHFPSVVVQRKSTAGENVHIIDTAFLIPQLQRARKVWIYLPEGYAASSRRYPVLYMHDGQNIFDDATSYAGEWGVDECIDSMKKKCIVVAIDNGGTKRLNEYCPYDFSLTGIAASSSSNKGEGGQYVDFLVKSLKPFIDKKYRTFRDKNNTFIAGSSMGGLISMYAVLKYPNVFGGVGVFSPAFWVGPKIFDDIKTKGTKVNSKIFFFAGKKESESMVQDMLKVFEEMRKLSRSKMTAIIRDEGRHSEATWRKEFPGFYEWIIMK